MDRSLPTDPPDEPVNRLEPYLEKLRPAAPGKSLSDWIEEERRNLPPEILELLKAQADNLPEEELRRLRRRAMRSMRERLKEHEKKLPADAREMAARLKAEALKQMASDPDFVLECKESLRGFLVAGYPEECLEEAEEFQKLLESPDPEIAELIAEARRKLEEGEGEI